MSFHILCSSCEFSYVPIKVTHMIICDGRKKQNKKEELEEQIIQKKKLVSVVHFQIIASPCPFQPKEKTFFCMYTVTCVQ